MAAKDLQIMRTRAGRVGESSELTNGVDGASGPNPMELILAAVRRQWPLLLLAVIGSGTIAWITCTEFNELIATAHMTLSMQELPLAEVDVYTTPSPAIAAAMLRSNEVLEPVIEKHGLPSIHELARTLNVKPDDKTFSITVDLQLDDSRKAVLALNDLGEDFAKMITQNRKNKLEKHAKYFTELQVKAATDLGIARSELVKLQDSERLSGNSDLQKTAELQGLINRRNQLESLLEQTARRQARIQRDQALLAGDSAAVGTAAFGEVLEGRRRQTENIGKGLTNSTRLKTLKDEIEGQLAELEAELAEMSGPPAPAAPADKVPNDGVAGPVIGTNEAQPSAVPPTTTPSVGPSVGAVVAAENQLPADGAPGTDVEDVSKGVATWDDDAFAKWIEKVSAVGEESLGDLDPSTIAGIQSAQSQLATIANEDRRLRLEIEDNSVDVAYYKAQAKALEQDMKRATTAQLNLTSTRAMELESDLTQKELKYTNLAQRVDQINQIRECQMSEYIVSSPARVNPLSDYKSDKKKLFAFALLGSGLLFITPSVLMELRRLRPTPVNVVSRRWNLPVLGMQSAQRSARPGEKEHAAMSQHELRLMALRIQQSLFQPTGRIVLFAGLDHEESPMSLIRSLADCFAQREESVLMIQTMPSRLKIQDKDFDQQHAQNSGRPGVAEFLAGDYEDASELVVGTGITGIDFLPGGCTVTASESMASTRLTTLIEQFRERYSMILLCGPSTLHPADLQMLAARADGIVFTVNKKSLQVVYGNEVMNDLIELGAPILGFAEQPFMTKKLFPSDKDASREISAKTGISA